MAQQYTVQVLNDKEYESLPFRHVRESMGCADPSTGMAFIRETGYKDMDMATLTHEVNHLIENHQGEQSDEDGIYYKSHSNFFSQVFGGGGLGGILGDVAAVALAPITGGASLGFLPLASAAGGAIQNTIQGGNPLTGALKGFGVGGLAAPIGGGLLGAGSGLLSGGLKAAGSGLISGAETGANTFVSGIPGFGAGGALSKATGLGGASFGTPAAAAGTGISSAPTTGGLLGAMGPSGNALNPALYTGANATTTGLTGAVNAGAANAGGLLPTIGSGIGGAAGSLGAGLLGQGGGGFAPTGIAGAGAPAPSGLPSSVLNQNTGLQSTLAQQSVQPGSGVTTAANPLITPGGSAGAGAAAAGPKGFDFSKLLGGLTKGVGAVGTGTALLGMSGAVPSPQFQMPVSFDQLLSSIQAQEGGKAVTPLGQSAQDALQKEITSPVGALSPALAANDPYFASTFATIDQNYIAAKNELDAAYNNVGQLGSGEYLDQLRQLEQAKEQDKNQIVAQENQRRFEIGQNQQYQAVQQALGVDSQTMQDLAGLSGMDVQVAAMKYGASVADVQALRQQLGTLGTSLVEKGLGISNAPSLQLSLLGSNQTATASK